MCATFIELYMAAMTRWCGAHHVMTQTHTLVGAIINAIINARQSHTVNTDRGDAAHGSSSRCLVANKRRIKRCFVEQHEYDCWFLWFGDDGTLSTTGDFAMLLGGITAAILAVGVAKNPQRPFVLVENARFSRLALVRLCPTG